MQYSLRQLNLSFDLRTKLYLSTTASQQPDNRIFDGFVVHSRRIGTLPSALITRRAGCFNCLGNRTDIWCQSLQLSTACGTVLKHWPIKSQRKSDSSENRTQNYHINTLLWLSAYTYCAM